MAWLHETITQLHGGFLVIPHLPNSY